MDVIFLLAQDQPPPAGASTNPVLYAITWAGEHFIGLFNEAGKQFDRLINPGELLAGFVEQADEVLARPGDRVQDGVGRLSRRGRLILG